MTFQTFQKKKDQKITLGKFLNFLLIINAIIIIGIYIVAMFPQLFRYKDHLLQLNFIFIIGFMILFLLRVLVYIFLKAKNGTKKGNLELRENTIILNEQEYPVSEIKYLRIVGNDIKGDFRGYISKGNNNELIIKMNSGEEIRSFFQQTQEKTLKNAEQLLATYKEKGILSEANFENILNDTNYY